MRLRGHPIHPMLVHFPIVFWTVAAAAYVAAAVGMDGAAAVAKFSNGAGLIAAMAAMVPGAVELMSLDSRSEAMRIATSHMMAMASVWLLFLIALVLPLAAGQAMTQSTAQIAAAACALIGFALMGVGGWLGGRLVYEFGVGVKGRGKL